MFDTLILLVSYLLGSSREFIAGSFSGRGYPQTGYGGNAGGTNAFRTQGFKFAWVL